MRRGSTGCATRGCGCCDDAGDDAGDDTGDDAAVHGDVRNSCPPEGEDAPLGPNAAARPLPAILANGAPFPHVAQKFFGVGVVVGAPLSSS